ncbi:BTB/POZ domain containing protein [Histomonas meleagridis]|uniref:BTB/POZ domain containing protein n=1 Tax=Histomonas meleagridis TaxID=135588 RepID=UPI003559DF99|nr:BTB/POZ domain containing protein [Histomonas meleagridis]KAH0798947.1 BTB/POZ domain containing protein [Histomonas meleagridis]
MSKDFQNNGMITDCTLIIDGQPYRSHTTILANSSVFFYNAFTSGMQEDVERQVPIDVNPGNLFLDVLRWFYTGKIQILPENVMCIFAIARFYGIGLLANAIENILNSGINEENLITLINQCYEYQLNAELRYLAKYIAEFYFSNRISISTLSNVLDIPTFCQVLSTRKLQFRELLNTLNEFIGDYNCTEEEIQAIKSLFDLKDKQVLQTLKSQNLPWMPL